MMQPRLYYPVKPFRVNQHFGDNIPCVKYFGTSNQIIVDGADHNTCPLDYDKLYGHFGMNGHNGTDLMAAEQKIYAACDGIVIEKQTVPARGLGLGILTDAPVDLGANGTHYLKVRYWHLKSFYVEVGDVVKAGDLIGMSDNTGYSSGNHLHFEGQPMDKDAGDHPYLTYGNPAAYPAGVIAGAIDLAPYFCGIYAQDIEQMTIVYRTLIPLLQAIIDHLKGR